MNLELFKKAGTINRQAINLGFQIARPGLNLLELDHALESYILDHGGKPAFKNYLGFPGTACLSVNEEIVHAPPKDYILQDGDLLTIDIGTKCEDYCTDAAETRCIGQNSKFKNHLLNVVHGTLKSQLSVVRNGCSLYDILMAGLSYAKNVNLNIFHQFGGHAIGTKVHEEPFIPHGIDEQLLQNAKDVIMQNYKSHILKNGQIICLEPIGTFGSTEIIKSQDGWTYLTKDQSLSAHFEHCVLIQENGYEIIS